MLDRSAVTLGILAGGQATRLGGLDKAWLLREGVPQVLRLAAACVPVCATVLVSANRDLPRHAAHGLVALPDRQPGCGPLGGLDALAAACATPWLFTLPVDMLEAGAPLLHGLAAAGGQGAVARDDEGVQPLVALYRVDALRAATRAALAAGAYSVKALQAALGLPVVTFAGQRFGNLNTPADLLAAGCRADGGH